MAMKRGPLGTDMTMVSVTEDRLAVLKRMTASEFVTVVEAAEYLAVNP